MIHSFGDHVRSYHEVSILFDSLIEGNHISHSTAIKTVQRFELTDIVENHLEDQEL